MRKSDIPALLKTRQEVESKLTEQIERGTQIATKGESISATQEVEPYEREVRRWINFCETLLSSNFVWDQFATGFVESVSQPDRETYEVAKYPYQRARILSQQVLNGVNYIRSVIDILEFADAPDVQQQAPESIRHGGDEARRVFVVHGSDELAKEMIARFIEKLKLDPIILHERPSEGKAIIEKLEAYGDVTFAVVLLTPDDVGSRADKSNELKPRARQNVVLELGYFLGRLGRSKVCTLYKGDVEIPSDYSGVVYVPLDQNGGWRLMLAKELRNAGMPVQVEDAI